MPELTNPISPASPDRGAGSRPHRFWIGLALSLTAFTYIGVLRCDFVYDDLVLIANNPILASWSNIAWGFTHHLFAAFGESGSYYRPLSLVWFLLQHSLFGVWPPGWHATSLLFHLAATFAVYFLGRRLTGDAAASAIAALLFGVLPVHVEAVAWVSAQYDLLMTTLAIASYLAFCHARERDSAGWLAASVGLYAVAVMTKEPAIVLPAVLAVAEGTRPHTRATSSRLRSTAWVIAPYACVLLAYLVARRAVLGQTLGGGELPGSFLLSLPSIAWLYIRHALFPVGLSLLYDTPPVTHPGLANFVAPALLMLAVAGILIYAASKSRAALLGVTWLCVFLLPTIAAIRALGPPDYVHDRYLYLPSVGLCVLVALAVRRIAPGASLTLGLPRLQSFTALALALLLSVLSARQVSYWSSNLSLFQHAVAIAPDNPTGHIWLAGAWRARGEVARSIGEYQAAQRLRPNLWTTNFFLGASYAVSGMPRDAVPYLRRAIAIEPGNVSQYVYLARSFADLGRFDEADDALRTAVSRASATSVAVPFDLTALQAELAQRRKAATAPAQ